MTGIFLTIDLAFFGANALKITHGGWLPLVIGGLLFTLMTTWKTGTSARGGPADRAGGADRGFPRHGRRRHTLPASPAPPCS